MLMRQQRDVINLYFAKYFIPKKVFQISLRTFQKNTSSNRFTSADTQKFEILETFEFTEAELFPRTLPITYIPSLRHDSDIIMQLKLLTPL